MLKAILIHSLEGRGCKHNVKVDVFFIETESSQPNYSIRVRKKVSDEIETQSFDISETDELIRLLRMANEWLDKYDPYNVKRLRHQVTFSRNRH